MSDSPGQTTAIPDGVDPLDALEAFEAGDAGHVATAGDPSAASPDAAPASATPDGAAPPADPQQAQPPGQEDWFMPGRFRTAEEMRANYESLNSERGRLAQELGDARQQLQASQAPPLPQQVPQPYTPGFNHPPQGYTQEQVEQLQYENPALLADYFAVQRTAEAMAQLAPMLTPLMQSVDQQSARNAVDTLRRTYGDEVVQHHSPALAELIQQDEGYFLDDATRVQRLAMAVESLEYKRLQQQAQAQPRDPVTGQFAAQPAPASVHVEGGSTGATQGGTTPEPQVDPVVQGMRGAGVLRDRFGTVPPELQPRRGAA